MVWPFRGNIVLRRCLTRFVRVEGYNLDDKAFMTADNSATGIKPTAGFSTGTLEFQGVVELLRGFLSGSIGAPLLDSLAPHVQIDIIRRDLERAGEAREYLRENQRASFALMPGEASWRPTPAFSGPSWSNA